MTDDEAIRRTIASWELQDSIDANCDEAHRAIRWMVLKARVHMILFERDLNGRPIAEIAKAYRVRHG